MYTVYCTLYSVHCNAHNICYLINLNFSLNILIKNSDRSPIFSEPKFGQASASDRSPVTGKKYMKRVESKYSLGGPTPFFPKYTEIWFWGWKKEYESRRKQSFDSKNVGTFPFFQ